MEVQVRVMRDGEEKWRDVGKRKVEVMEMWKAK